MIEINVTRSWFDPTVFNKQIQKVAPKALRRTGLVVRKIARDFVKHRKNPDVHSEPGKSPFDHYGLKASIVSAPSPTNVVIGPRHIRGGLDNVARLHEFGGFVRIKSVDSKLIDGVEEGDIAPVTSSNVNSQDSIVKRGATDPKTGKPVYWIKIRTKRQAEYSSRLYKRLAAQSDEMEKVYYPPRPYMRPALMKSIPTIKRIWENAIHF